MIENSAKTLYSFTLNTIIGVAGVFDVAGYQGVSPKNTNFGITLAKYGVPAGPYLMLPFFGPNDLRGSLAWGFEILADPLDGNIFEVGGKRDLVQSWLIWTRGTLFVLDSSTNLIENLYELLDSSFDPYVMARDAYGQSQYNKINNEE